MTVLAAFLSGSGGRRRPHSFPESLSLPAIPEVSGKNEIPIRAASLVPFSSAPVVYFHSARHISSAGDKLRESRCSRTMRYWWVNQNRTFRHELAGGLWFPQIPFRRRVTVTCAPRRWDHASPGGLPRSGLWRCEQEQDFVAGAERGMGIASTIEWDRNRPREPGGSGGDLRRRAVRTGDAVRPPAGWQRSSRHQQPAPAGFPARLYPARGEFW